jgi:DMSO/TMAO reductase YedYZ heme-binding membrane subunit
VNRLRRHLILMLTTTWLLIASLYLPYVSLWERISVASAWICMAFLCGALLIGPVDRIEGRAPRVNIYMRRDLGIWGALTGLLHFVAGNFVAMNPVYVGSFVRIAPVPPAAVIRDQLFSGGAILGLLIAIIFLLLLAISSDWALRGLGVKRWKRLQRSAHLAFWFTVAHGIAFQILEARYLPLLILVAMSAALLGFRYRARR